MNLSDLNTPEKQIVDAVYAAYKRSGESEPTRGYLGASILGHLCTRFLWYNFRNCCRPDFSGRVYRLFQTGQLEEARLIADLRSIGCTVHEVGEDGKQFEVSALGGHLSGHMDGCAIGIPGAESAFHVLEFKTHSAKSFGTVQKNGVKSAKPQHFAQVQLYMHLSGMTRALYMAVNKDTDEIYAERVHYDSDFSQGLIDKARLIVTSTEPPPRISDRPDYYECKWCDAHDICHGCEKALPLPVISCKQCCYATPNLDAEGAQWKCEKHDRSCTDPCDDHLCLPGLFPYAATTDFTDGMILFKNQDDGKEWLHGGFCYFTKELIERTREEL